MIERAAEKELRLLARDFRAVVVTGPRQSGKTTLVRAVFPGKPYALLEEPDIRAFAVEDPRRFLAMYPEGAILDEIQRAPELLSYLQGILDEDREPGQFILTGSCNFSLMEAVTQSLAGRAGILELLPFSLEELQNVNSAPGTVDSLLFQGLYPAVYDQGPRVARWYSAYVMTYLERDVRNLLNIRDVSQFQRFLRLCASNVGQLLNTVRLGADCGVHHNTIRAWLNILETSYLAFRLHPHSHNFRKRLVKTPKLYFYDTGVVAKLLGIENERQLVTHPLRGSLFENWCITELMKSRFNRGLSSNLYFWRNHVGLEIDVIVDHGSRLLPVEIKSGATVASDWFGSIRKWNELAGKEAEAAWLIYGGRDSQERKQVRVEPWNRIGQLCDRL